MIAVDTSVAVAAFAPWHEGHGSALEEMAAGPRLPAHAALETFSVLTRLPEPFRAAPPVVTEFLAAAFPDPWLTVDAAAQRRLVRGAPRAGIAGGAIYDALIGAAAVRAKATLVTRDTRARATYDRVGASVRFIA